MSSNVSKLPRKAPPPAPSQPDNARALVTGLAAPIRSARKLATSISPVCNPKAFAIPDTPAALAAAINVLPCMIEVNTTLDALDRAIATPINEPQALMLAGVLLEGYGRPPSEAGPTRVAALATVILDDEGDDDTDRPWLRADDVPISAEVAAAATIRLWRESKFPPVPSEFRAACMRARDRAIGYRMSILEHGADAVEHRQQLELRLAVEDDDEPAPLNPDDPDSVPF